MDPQTLGRVEQLCKCMYTASSFDDRTQSEEILRRAFPTFSESGDAPASASSPRGSPTTSASLGFSATKPIESIHHCSLLLQQSSDPYVLTFASGQLKSLVANHFSLLATHEKAHLKSFLLTYLKSNDCAEKFVVSALGQILAVMLKLAWFESDEFVDLMGDLQPQLHGSVAQQVQTAHLLATVVNEMNSPAIAIPKVTKTRKAIIAFRDSQLVKVFQAAISLLSRAAGNALQFQNEAQKAAYIDRAVHLIRSCLSFDFIGTTPDESTDDVGSLQVPGSWRPLLDEGFLRLLFDCYQTLATSYSSGGGGAAGSSSPASTIMECLSYVVSVRRSLYNDKERAVWVATIVRHMTRVLAGSVGMDQVENYHELCKMLCRFKSTYNLGEIAASGSEEDYDHWMQLVAQFSAQGLSSWQWSPNSDAYLLLFWAKCAMASVPGNDKLDHLASEVAAQYIVSRVDMFSTLVAEQLDLPFEEEDALVSNLEVLASFARRSYDKTCLLIGGTFDKLMAQLQATASVEKSLQLTYLIFIMGACIGGRVPYQSPEAHDRLDGQLSAQVLQLLEFHSKHPLHAAMDQAAIYFFSSLRKSYIGESAHRASGIYDALAPFRIEDQDHLVDRTAQQVIHILHARPGDAALLARALRLLEDLSVGYVSAKILARATSVRALLQDHELPFLKAAARLRNQYYAILSRILFAEEIAEPAFLQFMRSFDERFAALAQHQEGGVFVRRSPALLDLATGLLRDLRGFLSSVSSRKFFGYFWDWIHPDKLALLLACMDAFGDTPPLVVALLKFFQELAQNRTNRMTFDVNSVNGILLFRALSRLLVSFAAAVAQTPAVPEAQVYERVYKGIAVTFRIFRATLMGGYVNFGVFALYGDDAFQVSVATVTALVLRVPPDQMLSYPKLHTSYAEMVEALTAPHNLQLLATMDFPFFTYLSRMVGQAIKSPMCAVAANAMDNIATFLCQEELAAQRPQFRGPHCVTQAFARYPCVLAHWLSVVLNVVLLEESNHQWSLSRPLLPLILLGGAYFEQYCTALVQCQLAKRQDRVAELLGTLLQDVELTLACKSRDKLTANITQFRREVSSDNITLMPPPEFPLGL